MSRLFVPMAFVALQLLSILVITHIGYGAPVIEIGQVKCKLTLNLTEQFRNVRQICYSKVFEAMSEEDKKEADKIRYPWNSTIEEFEFDDMCMDHCIFEEGGMIGKDGVLPKASDTETFFTRGKVSDGLYKLMINAWNECLEISEKISKAKKFNKCKTATHHQFCSSEKMSQVMQNSEVVC